MLFSRVETNLVIYRATKTSGNIDLLTRVLLHFIIDIIKYKIMLSLLFLSYANSSDY